MRCVARLPLELELGHDIAARRPHPRWADSPVIPPLLGLSGRPRNQGRSRFYKQGTNTPDLISMCSRRDRNGIYDDRAALTETTAQ
jgi:hypothetical protein